MNFPNPFLIFGGPGCGKTEGLIKMAQRDMQRTAPDRIAFTSFTRQAAYGARARAMKMYGFLEDDLPWFRTLHSAAFQVLGMTRNEIMQGSHLKELCKAIGYTHGTAIELGPATVGPEGNVCLALIEYARATQRELRDVYEEHNARVPWDHVINFEKELTAYKDEHSLYDFTDILEMFVAAGKPLPVSIAYIDEAQDLTALQWAVAEVAFANCEKVMIGGDDDQAIYKWAGADVQNFLGIKCQRAVLDHSHRLPRDVHRLAAGISGRISRRQRKAFTDSGAEGSVEWHSGPTRVDFARGDDWLILARNRYRLEAVEQAVRDQGFLYQSHGRLSYDPDMVRAIRAYETMRRGRAINQTDAILAASFLGITATADQWEPDQLVSLADIDAEGRGIWHTAFQKVSEKDIGYLTSALRRGEDPLKPPRIRLNTIHGAKGAEAANVVVMTDVSRKCVDGMRIAPDEEHRCFYVAVTRASENLHIVSPQSNQFYPI
jgi:superfamily I DNA/RNA helicase